MQVPHDIDDNYDIPEIPSQYPISQNGIDNDDGELSELENFISLPKLLQMGGEEARRAEFILNQFVNNKN